MELGSKARWLALGIALAACSSAAVGARDFNRLLDGDYIYSGSSACVFSPAGFNANHQPLGPAFTNAFSVNGIRAFNGDGTGSIRARAMSVSGGGGSNNDFSGEFTYELDSDLTITVLSGPSSSTLLSGPQAGQVSILTNVPPMKGRVSEDLKTIHIMHYEPGVEVIQTPDGVVTNQRICMRERTLTRIQRGRGR